LNRRVILYQPHFVSPAAQSSADYLTTTPLSLLALGRPLQDAGYDVQLIDAKTSADVDGEIERSVPGATALGITCLTGYSVYDGLRVAAIAKRVAPDVPVVWGGWHPSFAAEQAAADPHVDVVVRGQGERAFIEVLAAIEKHAPFDAIRGITFREGAKIVSTPDRAAEDVNDFPPFAYDLIDAARYVRRGPGPVRHANTIWSRGCPYMCDFCLDSRTKWFGLSVDRIKEDLDFWVGRHGVNHLRLYDGNFFLGRARLESICKMIIESDLDGRFEWVATGVAHRMSQFSGDLLQLIHRAGCRQVAIGAESGSDELLAQITNKTTIEQTCEAVRLLTAHGINQYLFFMVGFPEEPADALDATLDLICKLKKINPAVELFINFCVPLPGSGMFTKAVDRGLLPPPRTFADWAALDYLRPNLPHISAEYESTVRRFLTYLGIAYPRRGSVFAAAPMAPIRGIAKWRLQRRYFGLPIEASLQHAAQSVRLALTAH
jgi:radical SAM superfamily enzyme YgiQ (UPF0313 family)